MKSLISQKYYCKATGQHTAELRFNTATTSIYDAIKINYMLQTRLYDGSKSIAIAQTQCLHKHEH